MVAVLLVQCRGKAFQALLLHSHRWHAGRLLYCPWTWTNIANPPLLSKGRPLGHLFIPSLICLRLQISGSPFSSLQTQTHIVIIAHHTLTPVVSPAASSSKVLGHCPSEEALTPTLGGPIGGVPPGGSHPPSPSPHPLCSSHIHFLQFLKCPNLLLSQDP